MSYALAMLGIAVSDGLMAQRKLDGDPDIIATDDPRELQAIVSQGKRAEAILRRNGDRGMGFLRQACKRGGVEHVEPEWKQLTGHAGVSLEEV
ncbi:MAG: hypothetical protein FJ012_11020 [Chloroflexi bacterium]|nr:hypothetical protein [Chloroflexota bacterium]